MNKIQHKSWLSPFLFTVFAVLSLTGILMLFHVKVPGFHALHEWLGIAFVAAGIVHLILNWKMFANYLSNKRAAIGLIAAILLSIIIISAAPQKQRQGAWENGRPQRGAAQLR